VVPCTLCISSDVNRIECLNNAYDNDKAKRATMWEGVRGIKGVN
jgi:hypothetical protein